MASRRGAGFLLPLLSLLLPLLLLLTFGGCDDEKKPSDPSDETPAVAPDFSLPDVNPNSSTAEQLISPRDYLGGVSCWYFTEST